MGRSWGGGGDTFWSIVFWECGHAERVTKRRHTLVKSGIFRCSESGITGEKRKKSLPFENREEISEMCRVVMQGRDESAATLPNRALHTCKGILRKQRACGTSVVLLRLSHFKRRAYEQLASLLLSTGTLLTARNMKARILHCKKWCNRMVFFFFFF